MTTKEYKEMTKKAAPGSKTLKNCFNAFWVGGTVCLFGQFLDMLYKNAGLTEKETGIAVPITIIALTAVFTGLNFYDKLSSFGGAGMLVPITGFANSMAAPAIEFKTEGHVNGMGSKMFTIAGPVLLYGVTASVIYGIILCLFNMF